MILLARRLLISLAVLSIPVFSQQLRIFHAAYFAAEVTDPTPQRLAPGTKISLNFFRKPPSGFCFDRPVVTLRIRYSEGGNERSVAASLQPSTNCFATGTAIIPSDGPLGHTQFLIHVGEEVYGPIDVDLIPSRFGVIGDALFEDGLPLQFTRPAQSNRTIILQGTGLGSPLLSNMEAYMGSQQATVVSVSPSSKPGLDEVRIQLPSPLQVEGCYAPLSIGAKGESAFITFIPVTNEAAECDHPLGLTSFQKAALDEGHSIALGSLSVLSMPGFETAHFSVESYTRDLIRKLLVHPPTACEVVSAFPYPSYSPTILDFGGISTLSGPQNRTAELSKYGFLPPSSPERFFVEGQWQLSVSGGLDVPAFQTQFSMPAVPELDNYTGRLPLSGDNSVPVRWNARSFDDPQMMTVTVSSQELSGQLVCTAPAANGAIDVPLDGWLRFTGTTLPDDPLVFLELTASAAESPLVYNFQLSNGGIAAGAIVASSKSGTFFVRLIKTQ